MNDASKLDTRLLEWLGGISEPSQVDISFVGRELILNCRNAYLAYDSWQRRKLLQQLDFALTIYINGNFIDSTTRMNRVRSWADKHPKNFAEFAEFCTAAIHAEDINLTFLAIQPFLNIQETLNRPIADVLGKPLSLVDSVIASKKARCIERAIATGGTSSDHYAFDWEGTTWKKVVTAIYLPGHGQILTQTSPYPGEEWQNGFWRSRINR